MAMSVGPAESEDEAISSINTTPLVDVMLVLLIIFLITIPVVVHTVPVSLPHETNIARQTKPENIEISVTKDGDVYWNAQLVPDNEALFQRLKTIAVMSPQPEVHIRATRRRATNRSGACCSPRSARRSRRSASSPSRRRKARASERPPWP